MMSSPPFISIIAIPLIIKRIAIFLLLSLFAAQFSNKSVNEVHQYICDENEEYGMCKMLTE